MDSMLTERLSYNATTGRGTLTRLDPAHPNFGNAEFTENKLRREHKLNRRVKY